MMNAHQKKCERCDHVATSEDSLIAHKQAHHGVLTSSMGFMLTNNDEVHNEPVATATEPDKECTDKKRKTKMEYLKEDRKVKSATKSKKDVNRSFKDQFLTQKKNIFNLQRVHGADADFLLIVKNNVQKTGGKNSATTAGKYMVVCEGNMKESFLSSGVQFGEDFVMMENDYLCRQPSFQSKVAYDK